MKRFFSLLALFVLGICLVCAPNKTNTITQASGSDQNVYSSKSIILMDENGEILTSKNEKEHLPVASMVKTMTLLLTMEAIDDGILKLDDEITATSEAAGMGGSQVFIEEGTNYKVGDLIKAVVVASGNDAAVLLAQTIAGSEQNFVAKMNQKAKDLGLVDTNFTNATGLPDANNYSCAHDIGVVFKNLIKHKEFFDYSQIWMDKIEHSKGRITEISNTNKLLKQFPLCDGGKTGSTSEAGFCISATAKQNDLRLIAVVVGAKTSKERFSDAKKLFNFGFANFESKSVVVQGQEFDVNVKNSRDKSAKLFAKNNFAVTTKKGKKPEFETKIENSTFDAPLTKGQNVTKLCFYKNGQKVGEVELLAKEDTPKITFKRCYKEILEKFA